jgi:hypothetical protein
MQLNVDLVLHKFTAELKPPALPYAKLAAQENA